MINECVEHGIAIQMLSVIIITLLGLYLYSLGRDVTFALSLPISHHSHHLLLLYLSLFCPIP